MEDRKVLEAEFHNKLREKYADQVWVPEKDAEFEADPLWANMKYYSVERRNRQFVTDWLTREVKGAEVLDYCCGNGLDSVRMARDMGAKRVVGIDISDVSVEHCRRQAETEGVSNIASFQVMDAEQLDFPDNSFDVVHIYGVLHHLDLTKAYAEIARVLRPGGRAIATEAMRHNPIIHWYRRSTPHLRTAWEVDHILGRPEVYLARNYFEDVEANLFNFATLAGVPFRRRKGFGSLLGVLEGVDTVILKVPGFKWWAWMCVFTMSKPRKQSSTVRA